MMQLMDELFYFHYFVTKTIIGYHRLSTHRREGHIGYTSLISIKMKLEFRPNVHHNVHYDLQDNEQNGKGTES